jgi:hypothetical protein
VWLQSLQVLLARFAEEKGLLARENNRHQLGLACKQSQGQSEAQAEVLADIGHLRETLLGLEAAVRSGELEPSAVKVSAAAGAAVSLRLFLFLISHASHI